MSGMSTVDRGAATSKILAALVMLIAGHATHAVAHDEESEYRQKAQQLRYYKEAYSAEIYSFCVKNFRDKETRLKKCLNWHDQLKGSILENALQHFGSAALAQGIYDQCYDYHPYEGVERIGKCVTTRLKINKLLADDKIEQQIYKTCNRKRGKHGASAIHNCANADARYYRDNGNLRVR